MKSGYQERSFYPYTDNGGSTLGIAGKDFVILAGDTRSTSGYSINSRHVPKLFAIGGEDDQDQSAHMILGLVGYAADGCALRDRLNNIVRMYKYQHGRAISIAACAQRLATILYSKRFFPYYVHAILGGLDESGVGALYTYDPVGSYEREQCRAAGAAASLLMPFLDNQVNFKNQFHVPNKEDAEFQPRLAPPLDQRAGEQLVEDAFTSATERHIEVGDVMQILVLNRAGVVEEKYRPLKKD